MMGFVRFGGEGEREGNIEKENHRELRESGNCNLLVKMIENRREGQSREATRGKRREVFALLFGLWAFFAEHFIRFGGANVKTS